MTGTTVAHVAHKQGFLCTLQQWEQKGS